MSMRRTISRVQSFPGPESPTSTPSSPIQTSSGEFERGCLVRRISAGHLSKVLDDALAAQKIGMKLSVEALSRSAGINSDKNFINCYLDNTVLLLDACNGTLLRLENIRRCLALIPIGLHCLEGEHEQGRTVLRRASAALESSCLRDRQHSNNMEKSLSRMRASNKKLSLAYQCANGGISPELYKALSESWTMAVYAIGELCTATSFGSASAKMELKGEAWGMLMHQLSKKMKAIPKRANETASMEELKEVDLAAQTLLKLITGLQNGGGGSIIRRVAVKGVAGELRRRREILEKALPELEEKLGKLYRLIVALRMNMLKFISVAQIEESKMDIESAEFPAAKNWDIIQKKQARRTYSLTRIGSPLRFIKSERVKPSST